VNDKLIRGLTQIFNEDVVNVIICEGLKEFYEDMDGDTCPYHEGDPYHAEMRKALKLVIQQYLTPYEYIEWLNAHEISGN